MNRSQKTAESQGPHVKVSTNGDGSHDRNEQPTTKPPTSKLLSAAKRVRDFKQEGRGSSRQLDIALKSTPTAGIYFRTCPDPDVEYPVAILRVKNEEDRKETYILAPEIADLPYIAPKVRNGFLVPCITSTGLVFVWARTVAEPTDRLCFAMFTALERVATEARKKWVSISWDTGKVAVEYPRVPIEDEPRWPDGQSFEEMYEIAIHGAFIDKEDHPVIRALDRIVKEV
jgi:hypothetical protein